MIILYRPRLSLSLSLCQEILSSSKAKVKEAVEFATSGSELPPNELYTDVYCDQEEAGLYIRGADPFTSNMSQAQA